MFYVMAGIILSAHTHFISNEKDVLAWVIEENLHLWRHWVGVATYLRVTIFDSYHYAQVQVREHVNIQHENGGSANERKAKCEDLWKLKETARLCSGEQDQEETPHTTC